MSATANSTPALPSPVPPSQSVSPLVDNDSIDANTPTAVADLDLLQSASSEKLDAMAQPSVDIGTPAEIPPSSASPPPAPDIADIHMEEQPASHPASPTPEHSGSDGARDQGDLSYITGGDGDGPDVMDYEPPGANGHPHPPTSTAPTSSVQFPVSTDLSVDLPPPAKRARKLSNSEEESTLGPANALSSSNGNGIHSASPPPAGPSTSSHVNQFSVAQHRFCTSTIRQLKKPRDAVPFLQPVDPIALNIPHYPNIIRNPMDLSAVERKLAASNPVKPDPNPDVPRYRNVDEFIADVRLIFQNAITFNGMEHLISQMGKRVEALFDKALKQMPPYEEIKPPAPKPAPQPSAPKKAPARRVSNAAPAPRRPEPAAAQPLPAPSRPKRETHPPPSRELPGEIPKKRSRKKALRDDGTAEQLKFCSKLLQELRKSKHYHVAQYFLEPVDPVALNIPSYPKLIKKPMDLGTMRTKLDRGEYSDAGKFRADFKLMIRNCFTFNPPGTPVNQAGVELQIVFDDFWQGLPPLHPVDDSEEDDDEEDEDDDRIGHIAALENQLATLSQTITSLKREKTTKKHRKTSTYSEGGGTKSKSSKNGANRSASGKSNKHRLRDVDEVLSFDQKKALSETIQTLDGQKLERVIQIIHEGVPDIRDSTEEIELDIDTLPPSVLTKLYNFVLKPPKDRRHGAVGGLKRKTMDEESEAERMKMLQDKIALFEGGGATSRQSHLGAAADESGNSSDSSSASDSSGSDSE